LALGVRMMLKYGQMFGLSEAAPVLKSKEGAKNDV
jgi:hypothetical protein